MCLLLNFLFACSSVLFSCCSYTPLLWFGCLMYFKKLFCILNNIYMTIALFKYAELCLDWIHSLVHSGFHCLLVCFYHRRKPQQRLLCSLPHGGSKQSWVLHRWGPQEHNCSSYYFCWEMQTPLFHINSRLQWLQYP